MLARLEADGVAAAELFLLDAAIYEDAAREVPFQALATFGERLVVDRPALLIDPQQLHRALDGEKPAAAAPTHRPDPPADPDADPLEQQTERDAHRIQESIRLCERYLQGRNEVDLTPELAREVPKAALHQIARLLEAHHAPRVPYRLEFGSGLRVGRDDDPGLTYLSHASLHALPAARPQIDHLTAEHVDG